MTINEFMMNFEEDHNDPDLSYEYFVCQDNWGDQKGCGGVKVFKTVEAMLEEFGNEKIKKWTSFSEQEEENIWSNIGFVV